MLTLLDIKQFNKVYEIMEQSFPQDEIRPYDEQKALLGQKEYEILVEYEGADIVGFFAVWNFCGFAFIEHFAVMEKFRNGGRGAKLLAELLKLLSKTVILEVERPRDEMTKRRIGFYERNGFVLNGYDYIQPPISKGRNALELQIMSTSRSINEEEYNIIKRQIYKTVYNVEMY